MPGANYPKDRVASTKYESGPVKQGNKPVKEAGSDSYKPKRAGSGK